MTKIDHISGANPTEMWEAIQRHVLLPKTGAWTYQLEQHRRWHWLDYMIEMGAYPTTAEDWDWVYMLGHYAEHVNCVFYRDETGGVARRRRFEATAPDVE